MGKECELKNAKSSSGGSVSKRGHGCREIFFRQKTKRTKNKVTITFAKNHPRRSHAPSKVPKLQFKSHFMIYIAHVYENLQTCPNFPLCSCENKNRSKKKHETHPNTLFSPRH